MTSAWTNLLGRTRNSETAGVSRPRPPAPDANPSSPRHLMHAWVENVEKVDNTFGRRGAPLPFSHRKKIGPARARTAARRRTPAGAPVPTSVDSRRYSQTLGRYLRRIRGSWGMIMGKAIERKVRTMSGPPIVEELTSNDEWVACDTEKQDGGLQPSRRSDNNQRLDPT
ncbi:hypothetical protein THAOC_19175 [Thalassiosira oceanica]|uniref:Uncharacterized protein n=1 Tax=Thalassiosira oceanica TaxID=159749 RepID=K0S6D3_THAOC|nr:hypothetical protein THAOC_19175 [Thalassiosira oceanica]|eukprot:EJK60469.1 hypothetical protein THAOC_19175 [Thalassiosira oceanica]